jgi:hypothetical protein
MLSNSAAMTIMGRSARHERHTCGFMLKISFSVFLLILFIQQSQEMVLKGEKDKMISR